MIKQDIIRAIINFYFETRLKDWGMTDDEKLALPTDPVAKEKIDFLCRVLSRVRLIKDNAPELLKLCDGFLAEQEVKEKTAHRSSRMGGFAGNFTDYPFMSLCLRAIRGYILDAVVGHEYALKSLESINKEIEDLRKEGESQQTALADKEKELERLTLINYYRTEKYKNEKGKEEEGFVAVIKYEDKLLARKTSTETRFQHIQCFNDFYHDFFPPGKKDKDHKGVGLLDRIFNLWHTNLHLISGDTSVALVGFTGGRERKSKAEKKEERREKHEASEAKQAELERERAAAALGKK